MRKICLELVQTASVNNNNKSQIERAAIETHFCELKDKTLVNVFTSAEIEIEIKSIK